jgi:hypothetical protein
MIDQVMWAIASAFEWFQASDSGGTMLATLAAVIALVPISLAVHIALKVRAGVEANLALVHSIVRHVGADDGAVDSDVPQGALSSFFIMLTVACKKMTRHTGKEISQT